MAVAYIGQSWSILNFNTINTICPDSQQVGVHVCNSSAAVVIHTEIQQSHIKAQIVKCVLMIIYIQIEDRVG